MLIFVAHGSPNPSWRASVERLIETVRRKSGADAVRLAYMEHGPPTLAEIVNAATTGGDRRIDVMPLFLVDDGHVERDIRPMIDELRHAHPGIAIRLLPALGHREEFLGLLTAIADDSGVRSSSDGD
jgi:sirohydrochlorin cobaltochelatase